MKARGKITTILPCALTHACTPETEREILSLRSSIMLRFLLELLPLEPLAGDWRERTALCAQSSQVCCSHAGRCSHICALFREESARLCPFGRERSACPNGQGSNTSHTVAASLMSTPLISRAHHRLAPPTYAAALWNKRSAYHRADAELRNAR